MTADDGHDRGRPQEIHRPVSGGGRRANERVEIGACHDTRSMDLFRARGKRYGVPSDAPSATLRTMRTSSPTPSDYDSPRDMIENSPQAPSFAIHTQPESAEMSMSVPVFARTFTPIRRPSRVP